MPTALPDAIQHLARLWGWVALTAIYLGFGLAKFTAEEATALVGIVAPSPLLGWSYALLSPVQFSRMLGVIELGIAALLATRLFAPRLAALGALLSAGLFLVTQSMLLSTPGAVQTDAGLAHLLGGAGQFLLKDAGLFALSLMLAVEAWRAAEASRRPATVPV